MRIALILLVAAAAARVPRRVAIGVDVGTGSARAGVVDVETGALLATHKTPIKTWAPLPESVARMSNRSASLEVLSKSHNRSLALSPRYFEQSSDDIWSACVACVRGAMDASGAAAKDVVGLGFDATCSLVCLDRDGAPVGIDPSAAEDDARNVILWADHRANSQASAINALGHPRLATVGGTISPEMEVPKMLWLLENMRAAFDRVNDGGKFLDLADFLAFRATDDAVDVRSLCTVVCKWNYDACSDGSGLGWDREYLSALGFPEGALPPSCIGDTVDAPGTQVHGVSDSTKLDSTKLDSTRLDSTRLDSTRDVT